MKVWKIGSHWGKGGPSVLGLFLDYECVFFDCDCQRIGNWRSVQAGDFFVICDGAAPVALGKAVGTFSEYKVSGFHFTDKEYKEVIDGCHVQICPAKIVILPQKERSSYQGVDIQKRFCSYNNQDVIRALPVRWRNLSSKGDFKIIPRTASLFSGEGCIFASNIKYRIPKYQRPYSWGENELRRLMETLREAAGANEPVFMGTMQLSQAIPLDAKDTKKSHFIIDGQQRITSFMILCNVLERRLGKPPIPYLENKLRTSVSKGEEQKKLDDYSAFIAGAGADEDVANPYIRAYKDLERLLEEYFAPEADDEGQTPKNLYDFIKSDKVQFVVIETHAGLSKTLQIFNTINTAGMDLDATDLFKIRFYEYLKDHGSPDSVFDRISEIYASVEEYNREKKSPIILTMRDVLRTYQRIIAVREGLPRSVFGKSCETFFEELFDTLLNIRTHDEFRRISNGGDAILSVGDLQKIVSCYKENYDLLARDWDFYIIRSMIWETRYGHAWDVPIIARFFGRIAPEQIGLFTLQFFKRLCPPSLYFGRRIYQVDDAIWNVLDQLQHERADGFAVIRKELGERTFKGIAPAEMLARACGQEIAGTPKWKNLVCRLVEYLESPQKDRELCQRLWSAVDIEHIQSVTDENNSQATRESWGEELNRLGNLVLLESGINRSIKNHTAEKPAAYRSSQFVSVRELCGQVGSWTKENAIARRKENSKLLMDFLLG